eukprot:155985-Prymnesium_polylepis.1
MRSDHRGFPDETSGRGVSIDDACSLAAAALPSTLLRSERPSYPSPLTPRETCGKAVTHRSAGRIVSFSCRESLHTMRAARA